MVESSAKYLVFIIIKARYIYCITILDLDPLKSNLCNNIGIIQIGLSEGLILQSLNIVLLKNLELKYDIKVKKVRFRPDLCLIK